MVRLDCLQACRESEILIGVPNKEKVHEPSINTGPDPRMQQWAWKKVVVLVIVAIAPPLDMPSAARAGLVINGGFESTTNGPGQFNYQTQLTDWTSGSIAYNYIYASGTADTTGSPGRFGNIRLWGPNNGSANGLPASSPDGGNFVAADGAVGQYPISQTISGLIVGDTYTVGFWWAGARAVHL